MLFVNAYPTSICYLLELKQPHKETKPSRQIPASLSKLHYGYNIIDFQLMQERPTVAASTASHKDVLDAELRRTKREQLPAWPWFYFQIELSLLPTHLWEELKNGQERGWIS